MSVQFWYCEECVLEEARDRSARRRVESRVEEGRRGERGELKWGSSARNGLLVMFRAHAHSTYHSTTGVACFIPDDWDAPAPPSFGPPAL